MKKQISQLKNIDGVGITLAERLIEAGFMSFTEIAEAPEKDLLEITGIKESNIKEIQKSAEKQAEVEKAAQEKKLSSLLQDADKLKDGIQELVLNIRKETLDTPPEKTAKELRREISRILAGLEKVEDNLFSQMKQLTKNLSKAESKLDKVAKGKTDEITQNLEKAHKKIDKALD
jgi:DNA integrity scanning protein DisA with diadenylate cyclase activity